MRVDLFDFHLPETHIATRPAVPRESARLLAVTPDSLRDSRIGDLPELLRKGDMLVFNDSRVMPARLFGTRGEVKVEILLHKPQGQGVWQAFARPGKRLKPGDEVHFAIGFSAIISQKLEGGEVLVDFGPHATRLRELLQMHGRMPLPPYIEQKRAADAQDAQDYQTVYAREEGSVAAPTAGLHFTPQLLDALERMGVLRAFVTLHVGAGTFLPVKAEDTADHVMHAETATLTAETAAAINRAREQGGRIIAVGTTSLRTLESAADAQGRLHAYQGDTDIFITPGYRFKAIDGLITNFHLPRSTLFMLVCALSGTETMKAAYAHAIAQGYRFYSYGDACLLLPAAKESA